MSEGRPACIFCGASYSDAMVEALDAATAPCACCNPFMPFSEPKPPRRFHALPEIRCEACGKVLYEAFTPES